MPGSILRDSWILFAIKSINRSFYPISSNLPMRQSPLQAGILSIADGEANQRFSQIRPQLKRSLLFFKSAEYVKHEIAMMTFDIYPFRIAQSPGAF